MRLKAALMALRTSMWFIPMLMVGGAIGLAYGCIHIDNQSTLDFAHNYPQPFAGGGASIQLMLSAIATSMITVSGITFSLTISALAQVSGQLTARVLRNFMSNLTNKLVLGYFVGLFTYCLIIVRTIRLGDDAAGPFVPALSVSLAMGLAVGGIGVLIYFIHYIALSVQASTVVSSVAEEALKTIDKLYPDRLAPDAEEIVPAAPVNKRLIQFVSAGAHGYIQLIDAARLIKFARENHTLVCIEAGIGDFVTPQSPLVSLIDYAHPAGQAIIDTINQAFSIRSTRAIDEEIAFGIRQLVDVALKALAPATADTTTAVLVLDYLSAVLAQLVQRQLQPMPTPDTLITKQPSFATLMAGALDQIRDMAEGNVVVLTRLLVLLQVVSRPTINPDRRTVLLDHTRLVAQHADATLRTPYQRTLVYQQLMVTLSSLDQPADALGDLLKN